MSWLALCCGLLATPAPASASAETDHGALPLPPHQARYEVIRRGSKIGELVIELTEHAGEFRYTATTEATSTLARMLRVSADESARFTWSDARIQPVYYEQVTRAPGRNRFWHANFDWDDKPAARGDSHDGELDVALDPDTLDPLTLRLQLAVDLADGPLPADGTGYRVLERDEIETQTFLPHGFFWLDTPAGCMRALHVERRREGSSREFHSWHAQAFHWMPVRIRQLRDGREELDIVLINSDAFDAGVDTCPEEAG